MNTKCENCKDFDKCYLCPEKSEFTKESINWTSTSTLEIVPEEYNNTSETAGN